MEIARFENGTEHRRTDGSAVRGLIRRDVIRASVGTRRKRFPRSRPVASLLLVFCLAALLAACGTVTMTLQTDVKSAAQIEQSVTLRVDGELAKSFQSGVDEAKMRAEGWTISQQSEGDAFTLRTSKTMDKDAFEKSMMPPLSTGDASEGIAAGTPERNPAFALDVKENLWDREYRLKIGVPASSEGITSPSTQESGETDPQMEEMGLKMLQEMFKITWKISVPGDIVETNADQKDGNTATWNLDIVGMQDGRELLVVSREVRPLTLQTEVKSPDEVSQTIVVRADAASAEAMLASAQSEQLRSQGWDTSIKTEGDVQSVAVTRTLDRTSLEKGILPTPTDEASVETSIASSLEVKENLFDREYRMRVAVPAEAVKGRQGQSRSESSWRITLPGEIIDSNAERRDGSSGVWYIDPRANENPRDLVIASRESKPMAPYIMGAVGVVGLLAIGGILAVVRNRRRVHGRGAAAGA